MNATRRKAKQYVWWPGLNKDVSNFVESCLPCARNRAPVRHTSTMVLSRPSIMELISLDFVGPRVIMGEAWYYLVVIDHCSRFLQAYPTKVADSKFVVESLKLQWLPIFAAPKVVLCDNGSAFTSNLFRQYITSGLMSHLIYSSPYYPRGNSINESCHRVLEHGIKCELQIGAADPFPDILAMVVLAYNSTYQAAIKEAPYALLFGMVPILPGFQSLSSATPEEQRRAVLEDQKIRRRISAALPDPTESQNLGSREISHGDFVIYALSQAEIDARSTSATSSKYLPRWSLPSKVIAVKDKQIKVVEYISGKDRLVPISECRILPTDIPDPLLRLNWEHITHRLPNRYKIDWNANIPRNYSKFIVEGDDASGPTTGVDGQKKKDGLDLTSKKRLRLHSPKLEES